MAALAILIVFCTFMMWASMRRDLSEGQAVVGALFVGPVLAGAFIASVTVLGMMLEGYATHSEQLDRCKRQAVTPHEYHQCR